MVQNNYKGAWETISPCNCNFGNIVYWYRPSRGAGSEGTGQILGWKKKFSEDILRQSYRIMRIYLENLEENSKDRNGQIGKITGNQERILYS